MLEAKGEDFWQSDHKYREASILLADAEKLSSDIRISAQTWNSLCWDAGTHGQGTGMLEACNNAVERATGNTVYISKDSRGIVRALTGNFKGAINDLTEFENFRIKQGCTNREDLQRRQAWVESLRQGKNPFSKSVLTNLQPESCYFRED
jgi:hypothetical protein